MPLTDMQYDDGYFDTVVSINCIGTVISATDIAPLSDEFSRKHHSVTTKVEGFQPPAAGFTAAAIIITVVGSVPVGLYLKGFLEAWAAADAVAIRSRIIDLLVKGRFNKEGRDFIPLSLQSGKLRFYFYKPISDDELVKQCRAAAAIAGTLPDSTFEGNAFLGEYGLFWDEECESWRGRLYGVPEYDEICYPDDL